MRALPWLLGAFLLPLLPTRASAVQIFIGSVFVHRKNANCFSELVDNGTVRFRCPPLPPNFDCGGSGSPACCNGFNPGAICTGSDTGNSVPSTSSNGTPSFGGAQTCNPQTKFCGAFGNISNDAEISFDQFGDAGLAGGNGSFGAGTCDKIFGPTPGTIIPMGDTSNNICNNSVFLCASIGYGNTDSGSGTADVNVDEMSFEIFKYQDGTNPLDPATPILRTFFIDQPGILVGNCTSDTPPGTTVTNLTGSEKCQGPLGPFCVLWDGAVNIQGGFGKSNGLFGFRANAKTNQTGQSGNIQITAQRAYPSGSTRDAEASGYFCNPADGQGCVVPQMPITVNVTNVHVIRSSPTLVGTITPVPSEPYNLTYRLSKDATMFITITDSVQCTAGPCAGTFPTRRTILNGVARVGEGVPNGSLLNGDSWNGRADNGDLLPPGVFLANFEAYSSDQYGPDLSAPTTIQLGLDPLQITDIRVTPLLAGATSLGVLSYVLTEPATVYIDIYPPGTQFCNDPGNGGGITGNLNTQITDLPLNQANNPLDVPKNFEPTTGNCPANGVPLVVPPVKRIITQQTARTPVISFWDGRDQSGNLLGDGDYVFLIYGSLPSQNGAPFRFLVAPNVPNDKRIWTSQAKSGFIPISRGLPGISQVTPTSSVIGSSPPVAGLNPFIFRYSLAQDSIVNMKIFDATGANVVRTIVSSETRPGQFPLSERWDPPISDAGFVVSSGVYLVQLTATDPTFPSKVSTTTALFPLDLYRVTDVFAQPLLSGASDFVSISYQLSQTMQVSLNVYPPGTVVRNMTGATWPPCPGIFPGGGSCANIVTQGGQNAQPVVNIHGMRTGRVKITENWDGRDINGLLVPDGLYPFVLIAQSTGPVQLGTNPPFASDPVIGAVAIQRGQIVFPSFQVNPDIPALFNSSNTIALHPFSINYSLTRQSSVTIQVLNTNVPPAVVRNLVVGQVRQAQLLNTDVWDGRDDFGNFPPQGFYIVRAVATDLAAQLSSGSTAQVTIAFDPLRIYDLAVVPLNGNTGQAQILYQVSEPMKTSIKIFAPGTSFDLSGNPSPPEKTSLIKRIIGMHPARQEISDVWDGTNLQLAKVQDGTYRFRIVGSTDSKAIQDISGNVLATSALAEDQLIDEIPVTFNGSADQLGDFERNTFAYPNPVYGPQATFEFYLPFQADLTLRIYNMAGKLVLQNDFGEQPPSTAAGPFTWVWTKINASGRPIARGIYYAVVRIEGTLGGKQVFQTVKKILIP